ncbi:MAG: aldo/keto reductase [Deltaproteobacteria bacterium]|nr:aldo/keto reductase [Deltaproteobacteria bacterium]
MKIILGTVQFGLNYGINNKCGKISEKQADKIFDYAYENDINTLDTANAYGNSETVIGTYFKNSKNRFKIITKLIEKDNPEKQLQNTFLKLGVKKIYGFLIHNFSLYKKNPDSYEMLLAYKKKKILKTGFSLYYPEELNFLIKKNIEFNLIQIPYSIFDRRFEPYFPLLKEKKVEIHIRSLFLQGLIFINPESAPKLFNKLIPKLKRLRQIAQDNKTSVLSLALNFVTSNKYIDKAVVGIDSLNHLKQIIIAVNEPVSITDNYKQLNQLKEENEKLILPIHWKNG